jgi:hypothetical protein
MPQSAKELLAQMLGEGRISWKDHSRLMRMVRYEKRLAAQSVSTCTKLEGSIVTIANTVTPEELTALYKVFNTTELLECILAALPPFEQLRARAVCKGFQVVIDTSPTIQRAMFRRAATKNSHLTPPPYPFLRGIRCGILQAHGRKKVAASIGRAAYSKFSTLDLRGQSILGSMLLAQPAPKVGMLYRDCRCIQFKRRYLGTRVHNDAGLTFGHMFQAMSKKGFCTQCNGFSLWRMEVQ